jgi:hypothetical protein
MTGAEALIEAIATKKSQEKYGEKFVGNSQTTNQVEISNLIGN